MWFAGEAKSRSELFPDSEDISWAGKDTAEGNLGTPIEWQGERGQQSVVHWVLKQTEDENKPKGRFLHAVCESAVELLATGQCEC